MAAPEGRARDEGAQRLDHALVARGLVESRAKARALIMAGEVSVDGRTVDKAGARVPAGATIALADRMPWVSRGGYKLDAAIEAFGVPVAGRACADVGACTGGFTDVLLARGASRVYAVDVGYGQLDWRLRQDPRVVVMERTNARYVEALPEPVELVVVDVSFISLRLVLPAVLGWLATEADVIALIKPQFEAGRGQVGRHGVVRDPGVHRAVLESILGWCAANGLTPAGLLRSPIEGAEGNVEFLAWLAVGRTDRPRLDVGTAIDGALGGDGEKGRMPTR